MLNWYCMKRVFVAALFLSITLALFLPQQVEAQGTYRCNWLPAGAAGTTSPVCSGVVNNCDPGYSPLSGFLCGTFTNQGDCELPRPCVGTPPPSPLPTGGGPAVAGCPSGGQGIDTALGCIPTENLTEFVKWALRWAIGIGGGIAFLLILWSGFQIMTSSGNPDKLKAGQEQLTAAISGLLFLIFSVFLLRLIGVDILQLPGFGQ